MKLPVPRPYTALLLFLSFCLWTCDRSNNPDEPHPVVRETLTGAAQKGPYMNGSTVTVAELTGELVQTGKNFNAEILDNRGSFILNHVELSSQFVDLKADGFYFNEVSNAPSSARLILYALSDLSDKATLNVNLMSHLERGRIQWLVSQGMAFGEAKKQAQREVLAIFSLEKSDIKESELLDISAQGDDHAILLAISVILQGHRSVAELSELLANIGTDIREDGELNDPVIGSSLVNQMVVTDLTRVRENLEKRYRETGNEVVLPGFEEYVNEFLENTEYEVTCFIEYPEFSEYGENILFGDKSEFMEEEEYSMAAEIPVGGSLMIRLSGGLWGYQTLPDGPVNWDVSKYDWETESQTFSSIESGTGCDLKIVFFPGTDSTGFSGILIEYFENQSDTANQTKIITVNSAY